MYKIGISIVMVIAFACRRSPEGALLQEDDSHEHSEEASQSTLFSVNTEFFIEYEPLEAGKESEFLVHVTDLQTYKPYTSGKTTILIDGVSVTSGQPERAGIYVVHFTPKKAGDFHVTYTLQSGENTETVTDHVHIYTDHDDPHQIDANTVEHDHPNNEVGEITFLKEQAWKSEFMVNEALETSFSSVISASGEIMAVPGMKQNVVASRNGMVSFTNPHLVQGSQVSKGQTLFTLSSQTLVENNVELQYKEASNSLSMSRSEYGRHEKLYENKVISERQYIASKTKYTADSLHFYSLSANTTQHGLKIVAPISGTIHELNVSEGQYAETGQILVTLSSNNNLLIRADLPQQYFQQLKDIETANFRPAYADRTYSIEEFNGSLIATGSSVAENDHYLPVYFDVNNDGRLLEGAFAELYLKTTEKIRCVTVPVNAISEEQGNYYLYVQVTGERFTKRSVTPGRYDGLQVEIIAGLEPGERIVTEGVMLIKAASVVTGVVGHGHSH